MNSASRVDSVSKLHMQRTRLAHLDGLRGFATLAVLYQHLLEYLGASAAPGAFAARHLAWTFEYCDFGKLGVIVFFAISGYIVPFSFGGANPRTGFIVSRVFRLYPAYWVSVALAITLLPALNGSQFALTRILANLTMLQELLGSKDILGIYWTLLIEILFYTLCFGMFCVGRLRSAQTLFMTLVALLAMALAGALARHGGRNGVPVSLPLNLAVMIYASFVRLATVENDTRARRLLAHASILLLACTTIVWFTAYNDATHKEHVLADVIASWAAIGLFLFTLRTRALANKPLMLVGTISYSIYLLHPLALEISKYFAAGLEWPASGFAGAAITIALTLTAAWLCYTLVERPGIRLGKLIMQRSTLGRGPAATGI